MSLTLIKVAILAFLCLAYTGRAAVAVLEWDANSETNLAGYRIYQGGSSRGYDRVADVGNVTTYTNDFALGQHFLAATAYDRAGLESDFSEEVTLTIVAPPALRFESNTLVWTGSGAWRVRWTTLTSTNTQIFLTNVVALGTFPPGSAITVQRYELGATNVLSDYSVPLDFNPPAPPRAFHLRVFLERSRGVDQPFLQFVQDSFFDAEGEPAFYRARLEITRTGVHVR